MIVSKVVDLKIGNLNFIRYKELGYIFNGVGDTIKVKIEDLSYGSKAKILCKCDNCGKEKEIQFKAYLNHLKLHNIYTCYKCCYVKISKTNLERYGKENTFQVEEFKDKSKETMMFNHGVEHPMYSDIIKETLYNTNENRYGVKVYSQTAKFKIQSKETFNKKYGVDHPSQLESFQEKNRKTRIDNNIQTPDELIEPFDLYRKKVDLLTNRHTKKLYEEWDGYDYYDGEYIKIYMSGNNHALIPSVDHKISVFYGFSNNIPIEEISQFSNLCITKMSINSRKRHLTEEQFRVSKLFYKKRGVN